MTNTDSFIDEVGAELRRDRAAAALRRWGWLAVLLVSLIVGGAAWNEWRKAQAAAEAEAFGDALRADAGDAAALAAIPTVRPEQRAVATLSAAAAATDAADVAAAVASLAALADDPETPQLYRELAQIKALALDPAWPGDGARAAMLAGLAMPGAPFRPLALEQTALDQVAAGDPDGARATLDALAQEASLPSALAGRIGQMLAALGPGGDG